MNYTQQIAVQNTIKESSGTQEDHKNVQNQEELPEELQRELELIQNEEDISQRQKESLKRYLHRLADDEYQYSTNRDRACELRQLLKKCFDESVDIDNPTLPELRQANRRLNEITMGTKNDKGSLKPSTRDDYVKSWRKYHHLITGDRQVLEDEALNKAVPLFDREPNLFKKLNKDREFNIIRNTKKLVELINSAQNTRDACYIALLIELGARPCEIHEISVDEVYKQGSEGETPFAIINVPVEKVDKPDREMVVTRSFDVLERWLEKRKRLPTKTDKLFVNLNSSGGGVKGEQCSLDNLGSRVSMTGRKCGLDISRLDLRHTSVQYWLGFSEMTEERLKEKFGWKTSQMIDVYRMDSYDNLVKARKNIDGIPTYGEDHFDLWECSSCGRENCPTRDTCHDCKTSRGM